jgi:hypothetical protein
MTNTYPKQKVQDAAVRTVASVQAERAKRVREWDSRSLGYRFLGGLCGASRPDYHGARQEEVATRLAFKATNCTEPNVYLTDEEIDAITRCWQ